MGATGPLQGITVVECASIVLGPLAAQIGETLHLAPQQKGLMVAVPILAGAILRFVHCVAVSLQPPPQTLAVGLGVVYDEDV